MKLKERINMIDYFTSVLLDQPLEVEFSRIKNGEEISSINIPYTTHYIDLMIKYYELEEQYERCQLLTEYKNKRVLSHDYRYN